jgi:hypothetical protein
MSGKAEYQRMNQKNSDGTGIHKNERDEKKRDRWCRPADYPGAEGTYSRIYLQKGDFFGARARAE